METAKETKRIPTDVILNSIEKYSSDNEKPCRLTQADCIAVIDALFMEPPK